MRRLYAYIQTCIKRSLTNVREIISFNYCKTDPYQAVTFILNSGGRLFL